MASDARDTVRLHDPALVEAAELAQLCGLSSVEVAELVEYGTLVPVGFAGPVPSLFSAGCVPHLRTACRLRADFDLDLFTVSLVTEYLQRIAELEQRVRSLEAHLPRPLKAAREGPDLWREPHM